MIREVRSWVLYLVIKDRGRLLDGIASFELNPFWTPCLGVSSRVSLVLGNKPSSADLTLSYLR